MFVRRNAALSAAIAVSLGLGLSGCNSPTANRSLNSVNQPVVERNNYTIDLGAGSGSLPVPEQQRLTEWFDALNLRYGDRVALDGAASPAVRESVAAIAGRRGILLSEGAPITEGFVEPGTVRVVVTRSRAYVPGCPNWSGKMGSNLDNRTTADFGCAVNSNLAAMIADPEHLLKGAEGTGETVVMTSTRAIDTYRQQEPTGAGGLSTVSSQSAGGN
jgi:pilus assembly protein CpaD